MNYLVMEVHPAYAVVLDEEGRFLKAANLRYQVGDTVRDIVELRHPREKRPALWKPLSGVAGLAACLCLVFFGYYQPNFTPYGALRIQINPDVELTLSRTDRVLELEGLNEDGQSLIAGYEYSGKDREDVTGELVERAIDPWATSPAGRRCPSPSPAPTPTGRPGKEQAAREDLEERYGETIVIQIGPAPDEEPANRGGHPGGAPRAPRRPPPRTSRRSLCRSPRRRPPRPLSRLTRTIDPAAAERLDYQDTDYGPDADGVTDYEDTDYGPYSDGVTDYEPPDDGPYVDGDTDYEDRDDGDDRGRR